MNITSRKFKCDDLDLSINISAGPEEPRGPLKALLMLQSIITSPLMPSSVIKVTVNRLGDKLQADRSTTGAVMERDGAPLFLEAGANPSPTMVNEI